MDINNVVIAGRLTKDPSVRKAGNSNVADISLAINRVWKDGDGNKQEETSFVDVSVWSPQAEVVEKYSKKGDTLVVIGRLKSETWDDKENGGKRSRLRVVADRVTFGPKKKEKPDESTGAETAPEDNKADSKKVQSKDGKVTPW